MKLEEARPIAEKWVEWLTPYCERVEIAGGVRRQKPEPHDIEIVCIPRTDVEKDMFGYVIGDKNRLAFFIDGLIYLGECKAIKNGERYKQLALPEGINLDLFIVRPETWAVQFTIRTGPAEFSHWLVKSRSFDGCMPVGYRVKDGQLWRGNTPIELKEEKDFLQMMVGKWIEPQDRKAPGNA